LHLKIRRLEGNVLELLLLCQVFRAGISGLLPNREEAGVQRAAATWRSVRCPHSLPFPAAEGGNQRFAQIAVQKPFSYNKKILDQK